MTGGHESGEFAFHRADGGATVLCNRHDRDIAPPWRLEAGERVVRGEGTGGSDVLIRPWTIAQNHVRPAGVAWCLTHDQAAEDCRATLSSPGWVSDGGMVDLAAVRRGEAPRTAGDAIADGTIAANMRILQPVTCRVVAP